MKHLPSELAVYSYLLDGQPPQVRNAFTYCLCLLMVEAGLMRTIEKVQGIRSGNSRVCVFETRVGDRCSVVRPVMDKEQEAALLDVLREIIKEEGVL